MTSINQQRNYHPSITPWINHSEVRCYEWRRGLKMRIHSFCSKRQSSLIRKRRPISTMLWLTHAGTKNRRNNVRYKKQIIALKILTSLKVAFEWTQPIANPSPARASSEDRSSIRRRLRGGFALSIIPSWRTASSRTYSAGARNPRRSWKDRASTRDEGS